MDKRQIDHLLWGCIGTVGAVVGTILFLEFKALGAFFAIALFALLGFAYSRVGPSHYTP